MASPPRLSVIIPALDEAQGIAATLRSIAPVRGQGGEVIVVDGGSRDQTREIAGRHADHVATGEPGRARQMNAGAAIARGDLLWFLHADTRVDAAALQMLDRIVRDPDVRWGRFGVRLDSRRPLLRLTASLMNQRSRLTGIATGDQGIFVRAAVFRELGGFPLQPLMEDIELSRRLRQQARPCCLPVALTTSARRWEDNGAWPTILLMWRLRLAYWRGADPATLAARYRGQRV